jgi:O-antigen ligase
MELLIYLFALILPWNFGIPLPGDLNIPIIRLATFGVILFWLWNSLLNKALLIDTRKRSLLLVIFIFIACLSISWAADPQRSLRKIFFLLNFFPLYYVSYSLFHKLEPLLFFLKSLTISTALLALFAIFQWISPFFFGLNTVLYFFQNYSAPFFLGETFAAIVNQYPSWLVNIRGSTFLRAFGSFPDPHLFSLFLNMQIPIGFFLFYTLRQKRFLLITFLMIVANLLSFSRAAYLALGTMTLTFIIIKTPWQILAKKPLLLLFSVFFLLLLTFTKNPLSQRLFDTFQLKEGSNQGRLFMWEKALQATTEQPFNGVGIGNFSHYVDPSAPLRSPIYAHNLLLDFSAETGLISAISLFLLVLSPIINGFRNKSSALSVCLAVTFVAFLTQSIFETPIYSVHIAPLFFLLLGIVSTKNNLRKTANQP